MPGGLIAGSHPIQVDITLIADIRIGDVATPCHAAAAQALVDAGFSIALVPVISSAIAADPYTVDPDMQQLIRNGGVRRVAPGAAVTCALALGLDARIFAAPAQCLPRIAADHRIVTVERPAAFAALQRPDLDRMRERAEIAMGGAVIWCPTSIIARDAMSHVAPDWEMTQQDWAPVAPNIPPVNADAEERARPTIGRARIARSRPTGELPKSFVSNALVAVRERAATVQHGTWPFAAPVERWPDDACPIPDFFAKIDLLANPDIAHDDPVPVEALMALSAGVVPCFSEGYREIFGGAALYGDDAQLVQAAIGAKLNTALMTSARTSGALLLQNVFSADAFVGHVRMLIAPTAKARFAPSIHAAPQRRVLFYSSNGIGMGHLTRQLAVARRLPAGIEPIFVSHSRAVDTVRQFGFVAEHLPYHTTYGEAKAHWNHGLAAALEAAFAFYAPQVVVFDGNVPFIGLIKALSRHPRTASVWIRRAMWGAGRDTAALDRAAAFDLVIEPLDPAWLHDTGPTVARQADVRIVPPVRILDQSEIPDRAQACAVLGLDPSKTNILLATGSGNNFDMARINKQIIDQLSGRQNLGLAVAEWQIAQDRLELPGGVARLTGYPFAQHISAFDAAIAAPGYNTFCEHLAAALPTIWVPNEHEQMDQQIERARYAHARHCGLLVRRNAPFDITPALSQLLDPDIRTRMAAAGATVSQHCLAENGARDIADSVADLAVSSLCRSMLAANAT